jgi:hypothetical protein
LTFSLVLSFCVFFFLAFAILFIDYIDALF